MQVMEAARGGFFKKRYAIMIVLAPKTPDVLQDDLRHVKAALLEWFSNRGPKAETAMFTVMTDPQHFDACESQFRAFATEDPDVAPIIKKLRATLEFPNKAGKKAERSIELNAP